VSLIYQPFLFEGQMCPALDGLGPTLRRHPESRPWLIRAAIGDAALSQEISGLAGEWTRSPDMEDRRLGLLLGDRLGLKHVAQQLAVSVHEDPDSWIGQLGLEGSNASLAQDAVVFLARVSQPGSETLARTLQFALAHSETRILGWQGLPPEQLPDAIPWIPKLLEEAPQLANQVASRFALLARDHCPALCEAVSGADLPVREVIGATLQKNLKRMGKIRLWAASRDALKSRPPH
jgi:hypothetical protein